MYQNIYRHCFSVCRSHDVWVSTLLLSRRSIRNGRNLWLGERARSSQGINYNHIKFSDGRLAMRTKSFVDILRSVVILKLCKYDVLVDNSEKLLSWCKRVFGRQLYEKIVNATFYKQFVAGEGEEDVKHVAEDLKRSNIQCMFCVPTETVSDAFLSNSVIKEESFDLNLKLLLECVDLTENLGHFAQSKITPVVSDDVMFEVAELLPNHLLEHNRRASHLSVPAWTEALGGTVKEKMVPELPKPFNVHIAKSLRRLDELAKHAQQKGVKLMLDAEHTHLQASIDTVILSLQNKYNQHVPVVYNTYQCYRKDTPCRLQNDIELARKHNFKIACKLVRGAYIDFERQRAAEYGYPDPICDTYEETGRNYRKAMDLMLSLVAHNQGEVMFATHNEDCILYGIQRMNDMGISRHSGVVSFGQLYGMCDHISYSLGKAGYRVHKSVPYGTLDQSILYLIRRAQENKSIMARTAKETQILIDEMRRRVKRSLKSDVVH